MTQILVIDDDPGITELLETILTRNDFTVLIAHSGVEGISLAEDHIPDVILLDLLMPTFGGIKILEHLRTQEATEDIPVLVVTAADFEVQKKVSELGELGPDDLLTKPFHPQDLISAVNQFLND